MSEIIKTEKGHLRRNWFFYLLIAGLLGAVGFFWYSKEYALAYQKTMFEEKQATFETNTRNMLKQINDRDMKSLAQSLAMVVASRVNAGEWEEIDNDFRQLIKIENLLEITLVEDDGNVIVSTNKKKEEEVLKDSNLTQIQETEALTFLKDDAGQQIVVAPVRLKDSHKSSLVIAYKADELKY